MRRTLRWIKRIVLGLLALALLLVALAIGAVHTDWGRNQIRAAIVDGLQADFPGSTIESLHGSPFGTLVARGITLVARDGEPLATVRELRVSAQLRPLLHQRVRVETLALSDVELFVRELPASEDEPAAASEPSEPSAWTIELPSIAIDRARVAIATEGERETIENVTVRAAVSIPAGQPIAVAADVTGTVRGKPLAARAHASIGDQVHVPLATISLGDASVVAAGVEIDGTRIGGTVRAFAPAALLRELSGQDVPDAVTLVAGAQPGGKITFEATAGSARAGGDVIADLDTLSARGVVTLDAPDLAPFTGGKVAGGGSVVAALVAEAADEMRVRGLVTVSGAAAGAEGTATIAVDATQFEAQLVATAAGTYERARARVTVAAHGPLLPEVKLAFTGHADVDDYRGGKLAVYRAHTSFSGVASPASQHVAARVSASGIRSGTTWVPQASLAANATHTDGTLGVALGTHRILMADRSIWTGDGGRVTITDDAIVVDDVQTSTRGSRLVASARIGRLDEDLRAKVRARNVSLALADPTLGGKADADVDVSRVGGSWRGTATVRAHDVAVPDQPTVDANVTVKLAGRKLAIDGSVENDEIGKAAVAAAVTTPRDITNVRAWRALPRSAVQQLALTIDRLDGAALGESGVVSGTLAVGPRDASGTLKLRGLATEHGTVDAKVTLGTGDAGAITVRATAETPGLPATVADASFTLPARPFDPAAWKQLGRGALQQATIVIPAIRFDPALFARFGRDEPYRGVADASVTIGPGATTATVDARIRDVTGGQLTAPVDVKVHAETDASGTRATVHAASGKLSANVSAKTALTVERALAGAAYTTPIDVTATFPEIAARDVLGLVGKTDVLAGSVGGSVTFAGTIAAPDIRARLVARGLAMKASSITNKKPPDLDNLAIDARWTRDHVELQVLGQEGADRLLKIAASGDPENPRSVTASIEAANFDLAPLLAFGTGPVRAARGTLNAALKIKGLDPQTGSIRGQLSIKDGRFPLSPELGNLRRGSVDVDVRNQQIAAKFDARLGAGGGSISGTLTSSLRGGMPMTAKLEAKLEKVSPIGAMQPQISADVVGNWANQGELWSGSVAIRNGKVYVPPEQGNELLMIGAPSDMIFIDKQKLVKKQRRLAQKPWLVTTVALGNTDVDVEDTDFRVRLVARGKLVVEIGDGMSVNGQILTTRGSLDLVGRRYRIEQAIVDFDDGSLDPRLDVRVVHDFRNLTLTAEVMGRASNPVPRLSGDRGAYTEGQLLSFMLGAEPGAQDSTQQQSQAVVGGSLAILSGRVGKRINKVLPVKFDSISYEAGTSSSSQAVRFGRRLGERSYLVLRQHIAPRPDENLSEAVFEHQFRGNWMFEAKVGERSRGGDFLWRKRW